MSIGRLVRALLGPAEPAVGRLYRGAFFDLAEFADTLRGWTDAAEILEVGCGDGLATEHLRRAFPAAAITGIDVQKDIGRLFEGPRERVTFLNEDLEAFVARKRGAFDLVVVCDVLHHVPPPERAALLRRASEALRVGGALVVKDWERRPNLAHLLAWVSDRFITGDRVTFETAEGLRTSLTDALGVAPEREATFRPWRNNLAFLMRPGRN